VNIDRAKGFSSQEKCVDLVSKRSVLQRTMAPPKGVALASVTKKQCTKPLIAPVTGREPKSICIKAEFSQFYEILYTTQKYNNKYGQATKGREV
jgi:hypothetical protein